MDGCKLILSITALAASVSAGKTPDQLALLGSAFTQLGDTLTTLSIVKANSADKSEKTS